MTAKRPWEPPAPPKPKPPIKITEASIARVAHETNRAFCEVLGDFSQPNWSMAPNWQVESSLQGVRHALTHPETTPESSHEEWMVAKLADGWKLGDVKDPKEKTHPLLKPYAELPPDQRAKDALFLGIVRALEGLVERES